MSIIGTGYQPNRETAPRETKTNVRALDLSVYYRGGGARFAGGPLDHSV